MIILFYSIFRVLEPSSFTYIQASARMKLGVSGSLSYSKRYM